MAENRQTQPKMVLKDINMIFETRNKSVKVLDDINLEINDGEFVCFIGPSGCGKSTLLRIIGGLLKPSSGEMYLDGTLSTAPGADRAMVFQDDSVFPWLTVRQNIEYGLKIRGISKAERNGIVDHFINLVGLNKRDITNYYPKELSGGMRKRVDMARAFANNPEVLLMDEPFGMLDAMTKEHLQIETLKIWEETKKTICFVTHDLEEAIFLADRIVFLSSDPGRVYNCYYPHFERPRDPSIKMTEDFQSMRKELMNVMNDLMKGASSDE